MKRILHLAVSIATLASCMFPPALAQAANKNGEPLVLTAPPSKKKYPAPETTTTPTTQLQPIPLDAGSWTTAYDGYGSVTYDARYGIILEPKTATAPSITHAALALANLAPVKNFSLSVTANTTNQLRQNSAPNPWEVCWLFFNYHTTPTGKSTNYILLKPNGIELGTAYQELGQTFLYTAQTTAAAIGVNNKFEIQKSDGRIVLYLNGQKVIDYSGAMVDVPGAIGVYTEDARVHVTAAQFAPW